MPRHLLVKPNSAALITAAAMILGGCAATGDDYVVGVRPTIVNHPVLGPLTIKEQDLLGPDADQNGVRDEIDKTLRQTFPEGEARERGESYALQVTSHVGRGHNRPRTDGNRNTGLCDGPRLPGRRGGGRS